MGKMTSLETWLLALDLSISVVLTAVCCKLNFLPSQDEIFFISSFADFELRTRTLTS